MASPLKLLLRGDGSGGGGSGGGGGGAVIPAEFFGLHINNFTPTSIWADYDPSAQNFPAGNYRQTPWPAAMSIKSFRVWDGNGTTWRNIERSKGVFVWDRLDYYVDQARANSATEIHYTLGCPPDWATAPDYGQATLEFGLPTGNHVGYNRNPPADMDDFADWCATVAARYAGRITHYDPWNEINDPVSWVGFDGTIAQMIEMATIMRDTISAIDPAAKFLTPNFTGGGLIATGPDSVTLDNYLEAGGGALADYLAVHGYNDLAPYPHPESILRHGQVVAAIAKRFDITLPRWNTEWAILEYVGNDGVVVSSPTLDPTQAAGLIARQALCSWLAGYRRHMHYTLDWEVSTAHLVDPDSPGTLLAPAAAWTYLANLLTGGKLSGLTTARGDNGQSYYSARFTTGSGQRGRAYWMIDHPRQLAGPIGTSIAMPAGVTEIRNVVGVAQTIGSTLTIGGEPQYLFLEAA